MILDPVIQRNINRNYMRILVTGYKGFIGRHLLPALQIQWPGCEIVGTENFTVWCLQQLDPEFDIVIHLGANIVNVHDRMSLGMKAFDDIALDRDVCLWLEAHPPKKAVVLMSSCAVDFPDDPYCIVKRTLEAFGHTLFKKGLPVVMLRPFSGYGEDQTAEYPFGAILRRAVGREDPLLVWGGLQIRDWVYVNDIVEAIIQGINCWSTFGAPIEVGTQVGTNLYDFAKYVAKTVSRCPFYGSYRPKIAMDSSKALSSRARVATSGWRTPTDLAKGLELAVNRYFTSFASLKPGVR